MEKIKEYLVKKRYYICITAGFVLMFVGFALADFKVENLATVQHAPFEVKEASYTITDISQIAIDTYRSNLTIQPSKDENIHITYEENEEYPIDLHEDAATLSIERAKQSFQFQFFDFGNDHRIAIRLELPAAYTGNLNITDTHGEIHIEGITNVQQLFLSNEHGDTRLNTIQVHELNVDAAYGSVTANGIQTKEKTVLSMEHGDITADGIQADALKITIDYGNLEVKNAVISKDFVLQDYHTPVALGTLTANEFSLDSEYGDFSAQNMDIRQQTNLTTYHTDTLIQSIKTEELRYNSEYGDLHIEHGALPNIQATSYHGSVYANIQGAMNEYEIISSAEKGDSTLPSKSNEGADKKLNIVTEYGDIDVQFTK